METNQAKLVCVLSLLGELAPKIKENIRNETFCESVVSEIRRIINLTPEELENIKQERKLEVYIKGL